MHKFPDIPIMAVGAGSQPEDEDGTLEYMQMPSSMETYHPPLMPEPEDAVGVEAGKAVLDSVLTALQNWKPGSPVSIVSLDGLDAANMDFVNQAMGEGEVSVSCEGPSPIRAQESVMAGVWRVQHFDAQEKVIRDTIEIGEVPDMVASVSFENATTDLDTSYDANDFAIQNAPALLAELSEKLVEYKPGDSEHTINLSLLPLSEGDLLLLGNRLGVGPINILSRGYGNCRIGSTAKKNAWWIKYYNSTDALILNTIEIIDVPGVSKAAPEDIADSAERLDEVLSLYR